MIKISNIEVAGIGTAIWSIRNSYNSWDKSDSINGVIGEADLSLAKSLISSGPSHCKFRRMISVFMDITAPLYFWKEFDTYKVGTTANSCSTMHAIATKEFIIDDFSHDHLTGLSFDALEFTINKLNELRDRYNKTKNKEFWYQMIQLLPSSYNQMRTVLLNYEVLANMYEQRRNHKLDEWRVFCECIEEQLPYPELITGDF